MVDRGLTHVALSVSNLNASIAFYAQYGPPTANTGKFHIPPILVVERVTTHRKPLEVRIWTLRNQFRVGTVPPSTSTPHCPAC